MSLLINHLEIGEGHPTVYIVYPVAIFGLASSIVTIFLFFRLFNFEIFANSYYRVVQINLLVSFLGFMNSFPAFRLEVNPQFVPFLKAVEQLVPGFLSFSKNAIFWFLHMIPLSSLSMIFYRKLLAYGGLYQNKIVWCFLLVLILVSTILTIVFLEHVFTNFCEVYIKDGILQEAYQTENMKLYLMVCFGFCIFYLSFMIMVLFWVTYRIWNQLNKSRNNMKLMIGIVKYCVVQEAIWILILIFVIFTSLNNWMEYINIPHHVNILLLGICSDAMTNSLPYLLIFFDHNVRKDLLMFCWKSSQEGAAFSVS
ncbi:hypothetical protein CAEBREN_07571 [Caenorhabditis brenneri]|uniref:Serpentine receptor class gamma n=1 Tax=Caenorhabditis brenneri TaxID=135651 RepID=G0M8E5_CAEBE|nr:hypothetical protein CAEBREN_07571 [Caenorhabditis brenneri]